MTPLKPSEVRLGNLTSHGVVVGVFNNSFDVESQNGEWYSLYECDILPVPLTPEILEGFGFEETGFEMYSAHGFDLCYITTDEYFQIELRMPFGEWRILQMKHAHTLQNFVQATSGVELVFNQKGVEK
jgi:hypothetical protein